MRAVFDDHVYLNTSHEKWKWMCNLLCNPILFSKAFNSSRHLAGHLAYISWTQFPNGHWLNSSGSKVKMDSYSIVISILAGIVGVSYAGNDVIFGDGQYRTYYIKVNEKKNVVLERYDGGYYGATNGAGISGQNTEGYVNAENCFRTCIGKTSAKGFNLQLASNEHGGVCWCVKFGIRSGIGNKNMFNRNTDTGHNYRHYSFREATEEEKNANFVGLPEFINH